MNEPRFAASRCLCAERDLLGDDEPCAGFGSISDELCEQAERESIAAGTWPPEPPAATTRERATLSERLLSVADGGCACGGQFKWTGSQSRCDRCDRHEGYPIQPRVLDLIREAAEVVKRHA